MNNRKNKAPQRRRGSASASLLVLSVALVLSLAFAALAFAQEESFNVDSGKSVLAPDVDTFEALSDYGVTVTPVPDARFNNHGIVFPISGGTAKPNGPTGQIEHSGGLTFTGPGGTVTFTEFTLVLSHSKAKLFAFSGEQELRIATLSLDNAQISGDPGADLKIKNLDAELARPAADALTIIVGTEIRKGTPLGVLKVKAQTSAQ